VAAHSPAPVHTSETNSCAVVYPANDNDDERQGLVGTPPRGKADRPSARWRSQDDLLLDVQLIADFRGADLVERKLEDVPCLRRHEANKYGDCRRQDGRFSVLQREDQFATRVVPAGSDVRLVAGHVREGAAQTRR